MTWPRFWTLSPGAEFRRALVRWSSDLPGGLIRRLQSLEANVAAVGNWQRFGRQLAGCSKEPHGFRDQTLAIVTRRCRARRFGRACVACHRPWRHGAL